MKINIRKANKKDYKEIMKLYEDFVERPNFYSNFANDSFYEVLKDKKVFIYLAEDGEQIVGFIVFSIRRVVRYPRPILEVEEFFILPKKRRQGIGKKLMKVVFDYAKQNKGYYIFLASAINRKVAHKFYSAFKFDNYAYHFRKKI